MSGLQATRTMGQGDYTGKLETFSVAAAHSRIVAPGDLVILGGSANAAGKATVDNFADGAITGQVTGVVASISPQFVGENLQTTSLAASTAGDVECHVDPNMLFEVDSDATLVVANVGLNAGFNAVEATASGGLISSNYTLDSSSVATTVTLPLRIVALLEDSAGVLGNRALVQLNNSSLAAGTVGV